MGKPKLTYVDTYLECCECGNILKIWRYYSRQKEVGHIKHMYCYKCKETTPHKELKYLWGVPKDRYKGKRRVGIK